MGIYGLFVICSVAAAVVLTAGQKMSYAENPNNYNCEDEVTEYINPVQQTSNNLRTQEVKSSYMYYNMPEVEAPVRYSYKYTPIKKYYQPMKRGSRFYEVFQTAGHRSYDQTAKATSGQSKCPAIQIYVV